MVVSKKILEHIQKLQKNTHNKEINPKKYAPGEKI